MNNRIGRSWKAAGRLWCALFILFLAAGTRSAAQVLPAPRLLSPPDSSINQPTSLTFAWRAVLGATSYELQISDTPLFTTLVYHDSLIFGQSTDVSGLHRSTTYYWRVRAQNIVDQSAWSDTWIVTTLPAPPPSPVPSSPPDGATVPTSVTLAWGASSGATSYRVQLSASPVFSTLVVDDSTVTATSRPVQGLANNFDYYWRVNASNAGGTSAWSASMGFTTTAAPPPAPTLTSPPNGAADQPLTVTLSWSSIPGAPSYRLQVSAGPGFATLVLDDSTLTATSRAVGPLANGAIYYWRVSAKNAGGRGAWSSAWYFATVAGTPAPPVLSSPLNGTANQPATLTLAW
ncbi:MAG: fibronectin type III domain-containing protein, partial [Ignavibacteria bacterium]